MIDYHDSQQVWLLCDEMVTRSHEYAKAREEYAQAKLRFDIALAGAFPALRANRPSLGVETAQMMLLEKSPESQRIYSELLEKEAHYKGLEKIIEALKSQITLIQSLIKNQNQNT